MFCVFVKCEEDEGEGEDEDESMEADPDSVEKGSCALLDVDLQLKVSGCKPLKFKLNLLFHFNTGFTVLHATLINELFRIGFSIFYKERKKISKGGVSI